MARLNLDMDVLRTLVTAQELRGFNRAAEQIGRSQSAVSQQIRKLEEQVGAPLFRKEGRGLVPTEAGDAMLGYARRILELNDEAVTAVRGAALEGSVRFGLPSDFAETWLPAALGRFKRAHAGVLIEAVVDRNALLLERLDKGRLDLALAFRGGDRDDATPLASLPMVWLGPASERSPWAPGEPLPLVVYEPPCFFRQTAIEALERAGISWRVTFTSPSLHGLWAAVSAGLGFTLRTSAGLPDSLAAVTCPELPPVPSIVLSLHDAKRQLSPAARRLRDILIETLTFNLATIPQAAIAT